MNQIIPSLIFSSFVIVAVSSAPGCYTQLAISDNEDEETVCDEIIILYPLPPPPIFIVVPIDCPTNGGPPTVESPKREFGSHRTESGGHAGDRRSRGSGGRDR